MLLRINCCVTASCLTQHMRIPTGQQLKCSIEFSCNISLKSHIPRCIRKYKTSALYREYVKKHNNKHGHSSAHWLKILDELPTQIDNFEMPSQHICQHCGLKFKNENCMRTHVSIHTRENTNQCNHCDELLCPDAQSYKFRLTCKI